MIWGNTLVKFTKYTGQLHEVHWSTLPETLVNRRKYIGQLPNRIRSPSNIGSPSGEQTYCTPRMNLSSGASQSWPESFVMSRIGYMPLSSSFSYVNFASPSIFLARDDSGQATPTSKLRSQATPVINRPTYAAAEPDMTANPHSEFRVAKQKCNF
jgi:hypothetical protein